MICLFIDSSHIIRPQGDILFESLERLPILKSGVLVHVHDIFTPKDYLDDWIFKDHILWNEQYLLVAFLTFNSQFRIIGALNYLAHNYRQKFEEKCPIFSRKKGREPGAFWMIKNRGHSYIGIDLKNYMDSIHLGVYFYPTIGHGKFF